MPSRRAGAPAVDRREIVALAVPAFLALVAEPLFLLADSAIVGHLGTIPLAGLGVAGSVLLTAANLFVFLAYATTSSVARQLGAGSRAGAMSAGLDGLWLSVGIGALAALVLLLAADPLSGVFGASDAVHEQAVRYLRVAAFGLPPMLVTLAVTGVLRGLLDTRTPLYASLLGFTANALLNLLFVHGLHWGIAGSAWGTLIAQTAMAAGLTAVFLRRARAEHTPLRPHPQRVLAAAVDGFPLFVRTIAVRLVLLLTVWAAAGIGDAPLGAHQVTATIWTFTAFALDALAIAAQAVVGRDLGAARADVARTATTTMLRWGVALGLALGAALLLGRTLLAPLFSPDPAVQGYVTATLAVVGCGQAISGYVFVADGVLMGAGDNRFLAVAMTVTLAAYLPMVLAVRAYAQTADPTHALVALWLAFLGFMLVRCATLAWRLRGDAWLVTGAHR
ncbi:MAG: MATE family efflux transporter [Dermatophilaceae bacterium]